MSALYLIDYRRARKTITDRPSVYTWFKWSGTIFVTIMTWNASIPKKIRSVWDSFLECSAPNVNRLFSGSAPFLEQNLVIILSDLRLGCLCQTETIWSIPDPVWCEQLHAEPIRYGLVSPSIVHIALDWFPNRSKIPSVWTWHELSIILSNEAGLHGAIYRADSFVLMLRYWVQRYNAPHPRSTNLYQLIHDTGQVPLIRTSFKSMAKSGPTMWKKGMKPEELTS